MLGSKIRDVCPVFRCGHDLSIDLHNLEVVPLLRELRSRILSRSSGSSEAKASGAAGGLLCHQFPVRLSLVSASGAGTFPSFGISSAEIGEREKY